MPDPCGHFLVLQSHPKDVFMVQATVLHGLDQAASFIACHGSILFKDALQSSADVSSHGDVTADVEVSPLLHELLHKFLCIVLEKVLHICLYNIAVCYKYHYTIR